MIRWISEYRLWIHFMNKWGPGKPSGKQNCHSSNKNSWEWLMLWQKWASTDRKLLPDWETSQQHHRETSSWRNVRKHTGSWAFHHKLLHSGNPAKENLRNCNAECASTVCFLGWLIKEQGTSLLKWWLISGPSLRNCVRAALTSVLFSL